MSDEKRQFKRSRDFLSDDMLGKWRFLELVVEERGGSEDILKVKAERTARRLKGLTTSILEERQYRLPVPN